MVLILTQWQRLEQLMHSLLKQIDVFLKGQQVTKKTSVTGNRAPQKFGPPGRPKNPRNMAPRSEIWPTLNTPKF